MSYFYFLVFLASFIRVVGSEFVQKYLGEGPRMVRDVFRLAKGINILSIREK
jgi:ATP-dependent 26S proteasome regulatory subunit